MYPFCDPNLAGEVFKKVIFHLDDIPVLRSGFVDGSRCSSADWHRVLIDRTDALDDAGYSSEGNFVSETLDERVFPILA